MKPTLIFLAHAPSARQRAAEIALDLAALGYEVGVLPKAARARRERLDMAGKLVLLWSRDAANAPGLRTIAKRARALGKLACVRLDAATPPRRLHTGALAAPRGRFAAAAWRRLLEDAAQCASHAPFSSQTSSRRAGLGAALILALIVGASLYAGDSAFAARVNVLAQDAHMRAADLVQTIRAHAQRDG